LLALAAASLCTAGSVFPDCPPDSPDFDGDGVADVFQLGAQPQTASILSGNDSHLIYGLTTARGEDRFRGIFRHFNRGTQGLGALAGMVPEGDHPYGSLVLLAPQTGQIV